MNRHILRTCYGVLVLLFACHSAVATVNPADCLDEDAVHILESRGVSAQSCMVPLGNVLFFAAYETSTGVELWRSDRTVKGTYLLRDIDAGPASSVPTELVAAGGRVYFQASEAEHGAELWSTNGTYAGTKVVADIAPGEESSWPASLTYDSHGLLYFSASRVADGRELWVYDLAQQQARQVADIWSGPRSSYPAYFAIFNGLLYFRASDPAYGSELWVSDGQQATIAEDLEPGPAHSAPYNLEVYDGMLHFQTFTSELGVQSYVTLGIPGTTQVVASEGLLANRTVLSWQAPHSNEDDSSLLDLAGYIIYYWTDKDSHLGAIQVSADAENSYVFTNLAPGNYQFLVTAVNFTGMESARTARVSKVID
jgi:ELWxxDGT repeat protein